MIDNKSKLLAKCILNGKKPDIDMADLVDWAENNRVLYTVALQNREMGQIRFIGKDWIDKLNKTLAEIKEVLTDKEYVVTRTYKYIEYVTFDVDVFVDGSNFKNVIRKFKNKGFRIESHDSSLGGRLPGMQVNVKKEGLLTIDLHQDFTWQKRRFLDSKQVMKHSIKRSIAGQTVFTPSPEIELLLCIADIAHERFNITLLDLIWLEGLSKEITEWELVFEQIKEYKWENIFKKTSSIINQISLDIYGKIIIGGVNAKNGNYRLPFFLSISTCWAIYFNTLVGSRRFPLTSFLYMHYNQLKFMITNKMPYYSPWHTG